MTQQSDPRPGEPSDPPRAKPPGPSDQPPGAAYREPPGSLPMAPSPHGDAGHPMYPPMPAAGYVPGPVPGSPPAAMWPGHPGAYPAVGPYLPGPPGYPPARAPIPAYAPAGAALHPVGVPSMPLPVAPPPADGRWQPARVESVPGTEFGLVQLQVAPITSGQATGSLIAGIGSILVSVLVLCFGVAGSSGGWGGWVAGAFTLLGVLVGGGAIALGLVARRQIRGSGQPGRIRFTGRGTATAGIACGAAGAGISLLCLALGLVLQLS